MPARGGLHRRRPAPTLHSRIHGRGGRGRRDHHADGAGGRTGRHTALGQWQRARAAFGAGPPEPERAARLSIHGESPADQSVRHRVHRYPYPAPWRPAELRRRDGDAVGNAGTTGAHHEARWLRFAGEHPRHLFPYSPTQPSYNKRLRVPRRDDPQDPPRHRGKNARSGSS